MGKPAARVAIVMGSESDLTVMREAARALEEMNVAFEIDVVSAHRTPEKLFEFSKGARKRGLSVIIAGAGGAAHLPGMIASLTELPVIGVPVPVGALQGQDALFSIVQMPAGVPVATVAIGGAYNAGILAAQILGSGGRQADEPLLDRIKKFKAHLGRKVIKSSVSVRRKSK